MNLPDDVQAELDDPRFAHRKHYSRATHTAGCHGPLCRLREAESKRKRYIARRITSNKAYQPTPELQNPRIIELRQCAQFYLQTRAQAKLSA